MSALTVMTPAPVTSRPSRLTDFTYDFCELCATKRAGIRNLVWVILTPNEIIPRQVQRLSVCGSPDRGGADVSHPRPAEVQRRDAGWLRAAAGTSAADDRG